MCDFVAMRLRGLLLRRSLFYGGLLGLGGRQLPFGLDLLVVVRFGSIAEARNGIYTRETACVFLEGSWANQFQPAIFAARIGALVSLLMSSAKRDGLIHDTLTRITVVGPEAHRCVIVPCTLHTMLHLEESENKEQRKAGGFNYDILNTSYWVWRGASRRGQFRSCFRLGR
jgi:hypothetical protein